MIRLTSIENTQFVIIDCSDIVMLEEKVGTIYGVDNIPYVAVYLRDNNLERYINVFDTIDVICDQIAEGE